MEKITCALATHVIPEGQGVKQTLERNKITNKQLQVVANGNINGIDTSYFSIDGLGEATRQSLRAALNISKDDFVFIFIGRIVKDKGINELISAFLELKNCYPQTKLLLVGPFEKDLSPLLPETERAIESKENIIHVGFQSEVRRYLGISDALAFPSYREGFPNVVLQAGSMGLPAVVTDINGCNEIIKDGSNGLVIPAKESHALYVAMKRMIENKEQYHSMKSNARDMITSRFEQQMVWNALLLVYHKLLQNRVKH